MTELGKPEIGIEDISVIDVSASEIELLVSVGLDNGNPVAIPVEEIDFEIFSSAGERKRRIADAHHGRYTMSPGKSTLEIPVRIMNSEVIGSISDLIRERSLGIRIEGIARIGRSFLSYPVPFSEERRISL